MMNMIQRDAHFRAGPGFFRDENGQDMWEKIHERKILFGGSPRLGVICQTQCGTIDTEL